MRLHVDGQLGGKFHRAASRRSFTATAQSFVFVPYNPTLESPRGFTIEAWLYLRDYSRYELSTIAARWTPTPNEQSWLFAVVGRKVGSVTTPSPGWFDSEVLTLPSGRLMFAFAPELAAGTQSFMSTTTIPLDKWVHVAATLDGEIVKIYIDGVSRLTDFGSDLRQDPSNFLLPFYALNGSVDEMRLSNVARSHFESADLR